MKELSLIKDQNVIALFRTEGGIKDCLDAMADELRAEVFDVDSAKGRKDVASRAHKASKMKARLDELGKGLVAEWKDKAKKVDAERKYSRDFLDALKSELRLPLTEWEDAEKKRVESERLAAEISESFDLAAKEDELFNRERNIAIKEAQASEEAEARRIAEQKEAELKRQKERELQAAEDARLKAEKDAAESLAKVEREKSELIEREAKARIEARLEKERAERDRIESIRRERQQAKNAEAERIESVRIAKEDERKSIKIEQLRVEAETAKRAEDKEHRRLINSAILKQIVGTGIEQNKAIKLISSIARGEIKGLTINY